MTTRRRGEASMENREGLDERDLELLRTVRKQVYRMTSCEKFADSLSGDAKDRLSRLVERGFLNRQSWPGFEGRTLSRFGLTLRGYDALTLK